MADSNDDHSQQLRLLTQYLFAEDPTQIAESYSDIFTPNVVAELSAARHSLFDTARAVDDAQSTFDCVMLSLDLPSSLPNSVTGAAAPSTSVVVVQREFVKRLKLLIQQLNIVEDADQALEAPRQGPPSNILLRSDQKRHADETRWHQDKSVVLEILAFLPAEFILSTCENVSSRWRAMLCDGHHAQSFWVGVVQQQFKEELALLLNAPHGEDLWQQDWRTIAMMIVCANEDDDDDEEDDGGDGGEHDSIEDG